MRQVLILEQVITLTTGALRAQKNGEKCIAFLGIASSSLYR